MKRCFIKSTAIILIISLWAALCSCSPFGSSIDVKINSPTETVDIVSPEIRDYINRAKNYKEGDYTSSVKTYDNLGNMPSSVKFEWTFSKDLDIVNAYFIFSETKDFKVTQKEYIPKIHTPTKDKKQTATIYNLKPDTTYYYKIEVEEKGGKTSESEVFTLKTLSGPYLLEISGVNNARDIGGYKTDDGKTIKYGRVYRSANLDLATDIGEDFILNTLGIKTELDLRNKYTETFRSPFESSLNYINIAGKSYAAFWENYETAAEEARVFANPDNYPIIFHCAAGADRTGSLAFALEALCGVSENDMIIDYELTPKRSRAGYKTDKYNYDFPAFITALRSFEGENLKDKVYNFFKDKCGLSDMELYNITALLTTDGAVFKNPPSSPIKSNSNKATVEIDAKKSGKIKSITANGKEYDFTYKNGILTVKTSNEGVINATLSFEDGTKMPIAFE